MNPVMVNWSDQDTPGLRAGNECHIQYNMPTLNVYCRCVCCACGERVCARVCVISVCGAWLVKFGQIFRLSLELS